MLDRIVTNVDYPNVRVVLGGPMQALVPRNVSFPQDSQLRSQLRSRVRSLHQCQAHIHPRSQVRILLGSQALGRLVDHLHNHLPRLVRSLPPRQLLNQVCSLRQVLHRSRVFNLRPYQAHNLQVLRAVVLRDSLHQTLRRF